MDRPISAWRSDLVVINTKKGTRQLVDFVVTVDYGTKIKASTLEKYLNLARKWFFFFLSCGICSYSNVNHSRSTRNNPKNPEKKIEELENPGENLDCPDLSIAEIGQKIWKSLGELKILGVTWTPSYYGCEKPARKRRNRWPRIYHNVT